MSVHGLTGMLKNVLYVSILFATPFENSNTCFSIYRRKAFECQRPIIMIVYTGVLAKYIIMAPPARTEWMVVRAVSDATVLTLEKVPLRTSSMNAHRIRVRLILEMLSK